MSKIEVNTVEPQCGTTLTVGESGGSVRTGSNNLQASDGGNLISQSGTTITLGASGDTITLASGASQTGFGRTGTVDWDTSNIKTSTFTAVSGTGYFANTSGGAFTMNLPAGSAGAIVSVVDYTNTFQTHNLTVSPNGSEKIGGVAAPNTLSTEGQSVTFVYVDAAEGWKNTMDSTSNVTGNPFLIASGGTETTSGNCKIHTFTGPGTFTVASASTNCASENIVSYFVLAGGGGGGGLGGGGGAGGWREVKTPLTPYTASPKCGYPTPGNRITVTAQAYPITVGAGGSGQGYNSASPASGAASVFSTITSAGGGGGGSGSNFEDGENGGSGGGGNGGYNGDGGEGNNPPVTPSQGSDGGNANQANPAYEAGGGGGANGVGGVAPTGAGGTGGPGTQTQITDTTPRAGGGGGGSTSNEGGTSSDGAGNGTGPGVDGNAGSANRGAGGGGNGGSGTGGNGGSGLVVIRYKYK